MKFEWDIRKSDACLQSRGFDFAYGIRAFLDPDRSVRKDERYDYEEYRYIMLGKVELRLFCLVYTRRGDTFRIISARKANKREVKQYEDRIRNR